MAGSPLPLQPARHSGNSTPHVGSETESPLEGLTPQAESRKNLRPHDDFVRPRTETLAQVSNQVIVSTAQLC